MSRFRPRVAVVVACASSVLLVAGPTAAPAADASVRAHPAAGRSVLERVQPARRARRRGPRPAPAPSLTRPRVLRGLRYGPLPRQRLDVHRPQRALAPAVLLVHGGGWAHGNRRRMTTIAAALANAGFVAVEIDYALLRAGLDGLPQQLRDLRRAVRWMRVNAQRMGIDPTRIGALGTSAGGHLAALLAASETGPLTSGSRVAAVVAWSAPLDLAALPPSWLGGVVDVLVGCPSLGGCLQRRAAASPLDWVSADDPPMLLLNSRRELVPATQAERMAQALRRAGVPAELRLLDGTLHAREYTPQALAPSIAYLRAQLR